MSAVVKQVTDLKGSGYPPVPLIDEVGELVLVGGEPWRCLLSLGGAHKHLLSE